MSEIRYDLIHDEYIVIAPERLHRPLPTPKPMPLPKSGCPFCPGNEHLTPHEIYSIKKDGIWRTRVIPNLYKALQIETPFDKSTDGMNERWGGYGAHEIVIDTPDHDATLAGMSVEDITCWLLTIQVRVEDLENDKKMIALQIFKNHGLKAGASQSHPHTQIIATPLISKYQKNYFTHAFDYFQEHGRSLYEDIFDFENQKDERVLERSDQFLSYTPYASSFSFESIILAKNHSSLAGMEKKALEQLAWHIKRLFEAYQKELGAIDYNLLFYLPPINQNFENSHFFSQRHSIFRFFLRVTPRIYHLAGYELLTHSSINPVLPEMAARLLRRHYETGS